MIEISAAGPRPAAARAPRFGERHVLRLGVLLAVAFIAASLLTGIEAVVGARSDGLPWSTIHLALAGGALVAIATFMPHFGVTLAGTRPQPVVLRLAGVGAVAVGTAASVAGMALLPTGVAVAGLGTVLAGLGITAWCTYAPLRHGLARRHPIVQLTYGAALLQLAVGLGIALLFLAGLPEVVGAWGRLKPAHAWLNLFGGLSLTIAATLVYLYPTVLGARIRAHPSLVVAVAGLLLGPPMVAVAAALDLSALGVVGAAANVAGAAGLLAYAWLTFRRRARWTTDPGWHRFVIGSLSAGCGWYAAAAAVVAVDVASRGPAPAGWTIGVLALPLVAGWAAQVLVGSWSHLLPAVGPASPDARAGQRRLLGAAPLLRLLAWNAGVALLWIGTAAGQGLVAGGGAALLGLAAISAVALALRAVVAR